jgi:Mg-chelatase subunit ChlD
MHIAEVKKTGDKMNRETRRRLQQTNKKPVISDFNINKAVEHHKIKEALDEGIMLGFHAARLMIYNTAKQVKGIGENRAKELSKLFDEKLNELAKTKDIKSE